MYKRFDMLLKKNNVKVADVTRATGIASSTFTDWKKGRYEPKADKMQKIADYFEVPLEYLTKGEATPKDVHPLQQPEIDKIMLREFNKLNDYGKRVALRHIIEMQKLSAYVDEEKFVLAAHDDVQSPEELELLKSDAYEIKD